jgi:hypothetical protein
MPNAKLCQLIMVIIVAACTARSNKVANAGPDVQCHSEQATGSLIIKSVCNTRAQRAAQQVQLDDIRRAVEEGGPVSHPTGTDH